MPNLYIVATPIGNLKDITLRALHILEKVDLILCEDTRITKKLLNYYNINTPVESYHQHSNLRKINYIVDLLKQGKNLALVSDSGTPGISDPGNKLIQILTTNYPPTGEAGKIQTTIIPVPGPSAITTIVSISGMPMDKFIFLGFPPHKKGRQKFFKELAEQKYSVILYESPYRIIKTLKQLNEFGEFDIVIGRELTKMFETVYRGEIKDVISQLEKSKIKGEFVIVVRKI